MVQADCTDPAAANAMAGAVVAAWGRLDLLVNNAGERGRGRLLDLDPLDWDRVVAVNLRGVFLAAIAAAARRSRRCTCRIWPPAPGPER